MRNARLNRLAPSGGWISAPEVAYDPLKDLHKALLPLQAVARTCVMKESRRLSIPPDPKVQRKPFVPWAIVDEILQETSVGAFAKPVVPPEEYTRSAKGCPRCARSGRELTWLFVRHPGSEDSARFVEGWLTVCERCRVQVNYFVEEDD
jgi:hypothetical protein